ncbi:MAG: TolC family protein [Methylococcaceae bacterium]|nr:TolC family protein [Methylococcaceae bacterium]
MKSLRPPRSVILALILLTSTPIPAKPTLDDPFSTRTQVASGPAGGGTGAMPEDPCGSHRTAAAPWSLVEAIEQALCRNPRTRAAWASARVQAAQVGVNRAAYLPSITVTANAARSANASNVVGGNQQLTTVQNPGGGGTSSREQFRVTPQVSLNYLLFDFGGRAAKLDNALHTLEAANWSHDAAIQSVMLAAVQAYYQVFATQAAVDSARTALTSSDEALKAATVRHEIGSAALADALQAKTAYAQAKVALQKAEGDAHIALGNLANALGQDADRELRIEPPSNGNPDREREADVHQLIEDAKRLRPDLAAAEAQLRAAEANVAAARSASLPTVSLVGNYGYSYSSVLNDSQSWSVGLQLSMPLFTGFANTYQIRGAEEQVEVQRAGQEQLQQTVSLDVWRAYHQLETARETLTSTEDLLASAAQSENVALGRYKAGAGSILDLLNAQAGLASARMQNIQARYNWLTQKAVLAQAIGRLDLDTVSQTD